MDVLIKWKGLPDHEAFWEPVEVIQPQFPAFNREDKVLLPPGSADKPPILFS